MFQTPTNKAFDSNGIKKDISWINYVRVICMFLVYFFHTENRAHFDFLGRGFDVFFKPFFVNTFFIVSGYLLYRKQEQIYQRVKTAHAWFKQYGVDYLQNILFTLIIPSMVFALVLFFPKMLLRHQNLDWSLLIKQTIGGGSLWFVAALAVAQLLIFVLLFFRKFSLVLWGGYGIGCCFIAVLLHRSGYANVPWFYQSGMCAVFFIWLGALVYKFESFLLFNLKSLWVLLLLCYVLLIYNCHSVINLGKVNFNFEGLLFSLLSSLILISFCSWLKPNKFVEKVGRSTIGLYFLSGAVPEFVSILVKRFFEFGNIAFLVVVVVSFALSVILNDFLLKHAKFVFDLRKIKQKN